MYATVAAIATAAPAWTLSEAPPCFDVLTLADALAAAKQKQQFLIVKATAAWCAPCKAMDKTTFRDPRVEGWIKENGLAIELDVDANTADARALHIMSMPTMIAYKGDQEFDRITGFKSADQLMKWLDGVKAGKVHDAELMQKVKDAQEGKAVLSAQERMEVADNLLASGRYEAAASEYVWLWDNIPHEAPELVSVRVSFMAGRMEQLASLHPPSNAKFAALRDAVGVQLKDNPAAADLRGDWIALNTVIDEQDSTLKWIEQAAMDATQREILDRNSLTIRRLLVRESRWELLGRLIHSPQKELDSEVETASTILRLDEEDAAMPAEGKAATREMTKSMLRKSCGELYAAMIAAKRLDDAAAVLERARTIDASPEMMQTLEEYKARISK
ncbi:MAG: thioredoxin domain-containing protein [Planctomycetota bacterium]|nr:thioredoxin domain-containing protein [Planctomycetota bacterium]